MLEATQASAAQADDSQKIDANMPASRIAQKFGGLTAFATALGKAPSTVHRWMVSGFIPPKHVRLVRRKARDLKIRLRDRDFFEDDEEPAPVSRAA